MILVFLTAVIFDRGVNAGSGSVSHGLSCIGFNSSFLIINIGVMEVRQILRKVPVVFPIRT